MNTQSKTRGMTMVKLIGVAIAACGLVACGGADGDASALGAVETGTGGAQAVSESGGSGNGGAAQSSGGSTVKLNWCVPGRTNSCAGPSGCVGIETCNPAGTEFGECACIPPAVADGPDCMVGHGFQSCVAITAACVPGGLSGCGSDNCQAIAEGCAADTANFLNRCCSVQQRTF